MSYEQIMDSIFNMLYEEDKLNCKMIKLFARYGYYMAMGTSPRIQLMALFSELSEVIKNG